ncbi:hypothetical protein [Zoogloea sp.]|uniref:hypothetical protein n=1 Tax=Zoogloea sp. TaxID=49181 RepID=UPI0035ADB5CF
MSEYQSLLDWASETFSPLAVDEALIAARPDESIFSLEMPSEFGQKWAEELSRCRSGLLEQDEATLLDLLLVAARLVEYHRRHNPGSGYLISREWSDDPVEYRICEPEAYHLETWTAPFELLVSTSFEDFPDHGNILKVQALVWFFEAAALHRNGDPKAFDLLFEVAESLRMESNASACRDAEIEERGLAARALAKKGAAARHAPSNQKAEEIRSWWLTNRDRFKSLDQAAEHASKKFSCAFRTAREHIGRENKELRSAGKA